MIARRAFLAAGAAACVPLGARAQPEEVEALAFSRLSAGAPLPAWLEPVTFGGTPAAEFALVEDEGSTVLRVRARGAASGLARALRVDPATHPVLEWRWKATRLVESGDLARKEGDDYAARLYVTFDLPAAELALGERLRIALARALWGERLPLAALCYVWDARAPVGTIALNAYTDRVRMVVADSGPALLGRWVARRRDLAEDFRRAFGRPAPPVTGVIVSADTDNTGESVETYFGDVRFQRR